MRNVLEVIFISSIVAVTTEFIWKGLGTSLQNLSIWGAAKKHSKSVLTWWLVWFVLGYFFGDILFPRYN